MSQPLIASQYSTIKHLSDGTISFDQLPNSLPATAYPTATLELGFHPIHLVKFALLLLAFLVIPVLSTSNSFPRTLLPSSRTKPCSKNSHRRRRLYRFQLPASYQPPQSVVDAPFLPLPTRRHFRISHLGNQTRRKTGSVVYTNQSSSESDDYSSEDAHPPQPVQHFRLVFGKRLRGEEEEFKGPSAMKGSRLGTRLSLQPSVSSSPSSPITDSFDRSLGVHGHHPQPSSTGSDAVGQQSRLLSRTKTISFAATTQACTNRISTKIDSSLSLLSCQLK